MPFGRYIANLSALRECRCSFFRPSWSIAIYLSRGGRKDADVPACGFRVEFGKHLVDRAATGDGQSLHRARIFAFAVVPNFKFISRARRAGPSHDDCAGTPQNVPRRIDAQFSARSKDRFA